MGAFLTRFLICLLIGAIEATSPVSAAEETKKATTEPKVIDVRLLKQEKKFKRIQQSIQGHKKKLHRTKEDERIVSAELEALNQELRQEKEELKKLRDDLTKQEDTIYTMQSDLAQVAQDQEQLEGYLQQRLAAFHRMGSIGYMNVIFSTSSLPDLLTFQDNYRLLLRHDQELMVQYRQKIAAITEEQELLQTGKKELLDVIVDIKAQEEQLKITRQKRAAVLERLTTEKKLYERALQEMKAGAAHITRTIKQIKKQNDAAAKKEKANTRQSPKKKRPKGSVGFAAQKGRLAPPVLGTVITFFGRNKGAPRPIAFSNGIDIAPKDDAEIHAIFDGTVVFAGQLRGYGEMIIIDHGNQYYSLASRASKLFKAKDDPVYEGEVIGKIDRTSGMLDKGLHFEIRNGTEPENPLHWVNNAMLQTRNN